MQISLNVTFDSDCFSEDPTAPAMQNCVFFSPNKILHQQSLVFSVLSFIVLQSFHIEVEILILHILGGGSGGEPVCKNHTSMRTRVQIHGTYIKIWAQKHESVNPNTGKGRERIGTVRSLELAGSQSGQIDGVQV